MSDFFLEYFGHRYLFVLMFVFSTVSGWAMVSNEGYRIKTRNDYLNFLSSTYRPDICIESAKLSGDRVLSQLTRSGCPVFYVSAEVTVPVRKKALKMVSYNVLYDKFLFYNEFEKIENFYFPWLDFNTRYQKLMHRIEQLDADILCTQETSDRVFLGVLQNHPDYSGILMHSAGKTGQPGVAVFYRSGLFDDLPLANIDARSNPNKPNKGGLYVSLSSGGQTLGIACGHLPYYDVAEKASGIEDQQQSDISGYLKRPSVFSGIGTVVYMGDYNATPSELREPAKKAGLTLLESSKSYPTCYEDGEDNGRLFSNPVKIDHILFRLANGVTLKEEASVTKKRLTPSRDRRQVALDGEEPSDHLPISAILTLP